MLDFPVPTLAGQKFKAQNGVTYTWDGLAWYVSSADLGGGGAAYELPPATVAALGGVFASSQPDANNPIIGINESGAAVYGPVGHATTADSATNATNAGHATTADSATNATTADSATNAGHANTADSATNATNAVNATNAGNADTLDGQHAAAFAPAVHTHAVPAPTPTSLGGVHQVLHTDGTYVRGVDAAGNFLYGPVIEDQVAPPIDIPDGSLSILFEGIPTWAKNIYVVWYDVVLTAGIPIIQVGTGPADGGVSGWVTAGYTQQATNFVGNLASPKGFNFALAASSGYVSSLIYTLAKADTTKWVCTHNGTVLNYYVLLGCGNINMPGELTKIRITSDTGAGVYKSGRIAVLYS
jgi:hypothetical protein